MYWPDFVFPPINLYSMPPRFTTQYMEMEHEFCNEELEEFYAEPEYTMRKELLRELVLEKRKEFNKLWNARARSG